MNTAAIASLVAGIAAWAGLPVFAALVAVICGHVALGQIRRAPDASRGRELAMIGLTLGWLQLGLILLVVGGGLLLALLGAAVGGVTVVLLLGLGLLLLALVALACGALFVFG